MTELVLVIVIVGVLAVFAMPRFFDLGRFSERGYFDAALAAARFAHTHAIASGCNIRLRFTAGGYAVTRAATCAGTAFGPPVTNPAHGTPYAEAPPSGVAVSAADLYFDSAGRPRDPATGNLLATSTNVAIGGRTLRIEQQSGYAHTP